MPIVEMDQVESEKKKGRKKGYQVRTKRKKRKKQHLNQEEQSIRHPASVVPLQLGNISFDVWIRVVHPYPFTFKTFAKERWLGRTILDVYSTEFGSYPSSYYKAAIEQGRILISGASVGIEYKICGQDVLTHTVHRHEPCVAVSDQEGSIQVVAETETLLAVDKPCTLPVHPCGSYSQNSMLHLLQPKFGKLYNIHRLDRLPSGLVVVAKSSQESKTKCIQRRDGFDKLYLARVKGRFPLNCRTKALPLLSRFPPHGQLPPEVTSSRAVGSASDLREQNAFGYWLGNATGTHQASKATLDTMTTDVSCSLDEWLSEESSGKPGDVLWFHIASPCRIADPKKGACETGKFDDLDDETYMSSAKAALTSIAVLRFDSETDSTVVVCRPQTGRTHQIRLHLGLVGHPIANDLSYGGDMWFGNERGSEACIKAQAMLDQMSEESEKNKTPKGAVSTDTPASEQEVRNLTTVSRTEDESMNDFIRRTCVWCARCQGDSSSRSLLEFLVRSQGIWLHALRYTMKDENGSTVSFRTKAPTWS